MDIRVGDLVVPFAGEGEWPGLYLVRRIDDDDGTLFCLDLLRNEPVFLWSKYIRFIYEPSFNADVEGRLGQGYTTSTGQVLSHVHERNESCAQGCVIHSPSVHKMNGWPTHWRSDRLLMERICPHGVGHPDPDHVSFTVRTKGLEAARTEQVHGCDGCCKGALDFLWPWTTRYGDGVDRPHFEQPEAPRRDWWPDPRDAA